MHKYNRYIALLLMSLALFGIVPLHAQEQQIIYIRKAMSLDTLKAYPDTTTTNAIYDSLGAYSDTTITNAILDSLGAYYDSVYINSHYNYFTNDSVVWDTLGAYFDTTNHFGVFDSFYIQNTAGTTSTSGFITSGDTLFIDTTSGGGGGSVRGGLQVRDLTGNDTLWVGEDSLYQYLNPNGANRIIYLDTTGAKVGDRFIIRNNDSYSSDKYLQIYDMGSSIDYIYSQAKREYIFNGSNWVSGDNETGISTDGNVAIGYKSEGSGDGIAIGYNTNAYNSSVAIGYNTDGSINGTAVGYWSYGNNYGAALGRQANGSSYGAAVGKQANGSSYGAALGYYSNAYYNGVAIGYVTNSNNKNYAIAKGYRSKCERYNEEWKCADGASINKYGYGQVDWFAELDTSTATEIFLGGVASNRFTILAKSVVSFSILVSALDTITGDGAGYKIEGAIKRDAVNDSVSIVGSVTKTVLAEDDASWDVNVSADNVNKALIMTVASDTTNTVRWNAEMTYSEARY